MKIGIITIIDGDNYGNLLQNYALQRVLSGLGHTAETIDRRLRKSLNSHLGMVLFFIKFVYHLIFKRCNDIPRLSRRDKFNEFKKKYIKYSDFRVGNNCFPDRYEKEYDCFIFGSDQIWNVYFKIITDDIDIYFGRFSTKNKKIAYAASFGLNCIPDRYSSYVKRSLSDFYAIGVREFEGQEILKNININADVVPDPTLLLTDQDWREVEKRPLFLKDEKYVLTYFLGEYNKSRYDDIDKFATKKGLRVFNLNNSIMNCKTKDDRELFSCSPDEFIWLIDNCDYLFTDSFHCTVFALVFCKRFQVFYRKAFESGNEMESRIKSLLKLFEEEERYVKNQVCSEIIEKPLDCSRINTIKSELANKGSGFLYNYLNEIKISN